MSEKEMPQRFHPERNGTLRYQCDRCRGNITAKCAQSSATCLLQQAKVTTWCACARGQVHMYVLVPVPPSPTPIPQKVQEMSLAGSNTNSVRGACWYEPEPAQGGNNPEVHLPFLLISTCKRISAGPRKHQGFAWLLSKATRAALAPSINPLQSFRYSLATCPHTLHRLAVPSHPSPWKETYWRFTDTALSPSPRSPRHHSRFLPGSFLFPLLPFPSVHPECLLFPSFPWMLVSVSAEKGGY